MLNSASLLQQLIAVPLPVPKAGWWWSFAPPLPQPQLSVLQSHRPPRALAFRPVGGGSALADWLEWCKKAEPGRQRIWADREGRRAQTNESPQSPPAAATAVSRTGPFRLVH